MSQVTDETSTTSAEPGAVRSVVRDGIRIDWDVPVVMDDGAILRADVYRPDAIGEFPIIMSHGPYAKGLTFEAGYPKQWAQLIEEFPEVLDRSSGQYTAWELLDPDQWVPKGYALVRVDSRGAGRSPGFLDVFSSREAKDFYDCIESFAARSWSNGKVGLTGVSYYAKNQWQVAALRPPHLAAICVWEGANDYYRDQLRHGGIHNSFMSKWFSRADTFQHGVGSRGFSNPLSGLNAAGDDDLDDATLAANRDDLPGQVLAHPFDDDWYADHSAVVEEIQVPLLSAGNWGGLGQHQRGNLLGWMRSGSPEKWLEVHAGTHWGAFYSTDGQDLQRRFFDHFLKGTGDWLQQPRVQLQIRHVDGTTTQRFEQEWPIARTQWQHLYLDADSEELVVRAPQQSAANTYVANSAGVTFRTAPLTTPLEVTGPLTAKLWISSSTTDADLFLVLRAFDPDGNEVLFQGANDPQTPLSQGWLRASHRALDPARSEPWLPFHLHTQAQPLEPGRVYEVDIEVWSTCIELPVGYRLALTVTGEDFNHGLGDTPDGLGGIQHGQGPFHHKHPDDRPAQTFANDVTIYSSPDRPSSLLVPVIRGELPGA
jgi:uncharacterized protein